MSIHQQLIAGQWVDGQGSPLRWQSPVDGAITWEGGSASASQIDNAVHAARKAAPAWARLTLQDRIPCLKRFGQLLVSHATMLSAMISRETGKPAWEAAAEVETMVRKIPLSIQAYRERRTPATHDERGTLAATRYKPHGVVGVLGPFNFPGHLPNGHIVPALLAGNVVIFKPSEQSPGVGALTAQLWQEADLPAGVFQMLQGGRDVGSAMVRHPQLDGLFFTGSFAAGASISATLAHQPGKILALELGGNNPLIAWNTDDIDAAVYYTIVSAFITSGQRCSCARRLIVADNVNGDRLVQQLVDASQRLRIGPPDAEPAPFMGTVISASAADQILSAQEQLIAHGGVSLLPCRALPLSAAMLTPGIIDVTRATNRPDVEIFGPLLQVIRVRDSDAAIVEANQTAYGLCAGLLSDDRDLYERFYAAARAGLINWNRPTTGASSALPFGGIGHSGNHRPSGSWAADYCSYPVASLENSVLAMPPERFPGMQ